MPCSRRKWTRFAHLVQGGDWHLHTDATDGRSTPADYFARAEEEGLGFLLFSEHVRREILYDYLKFKEEVYAAGARYNIPFAVGAETKVLNEAGDFDISDEVAAEAEVILFSFHSRYFPTVESYLTAIENAARNPLADIWAHPTSYHSEMEFEIGASGWGRVLACLVEEEVCFELNRKYPPPQGELLRLLREMPVATTSGSDAHHCEELLRRVDIAGLDLQLGRPVGPLTP